MGDDLSALPSGSINNNGEIGATATDRIAKKAGSQKETEALKDSRGNEDPGGCGSSRLAASVPYSMSFRTD